jgi:rRNA maturation RNase YbeY
MNRRFLGHRGATDVISFPLDEKKAVEGEVYVNLDKAREQAGRERVPEHEEILRLVVHGVLHLLGYDDGTVRLRLGMKRREDRCLRALGCGEGMKGLL